MITNRQKELLKLLTEQNDYQTVEIFSSRLGVSKRTIHSDLKVIGEYVQSSGQYIDKKRGVGVALKKLKEEGRDIQKNHKDSDIYTTINRRTQIMIMLLFEDKKVSYNYLSELFLVSKTSIIKDLEFVMKILNIGSDIKLISDISGTKLVGSEEDIQKAFLQFNRYLLSNSEYDQNSKIYEKTISLFSYYGERLVNVCSNILYTFVRENVNAISDYYVQNILNIFMILIYRISRNHHHKEVEVYAGFEQDMFFEKSAVQLLHKAALRLEIAYTNEDVQFLSKQLISNRFESMPEEEVDDELVNQLLSKVSKALDIDFSNDKKLEEQLQNHIPPMIYRLQTKNKTDNPFTSQIKNEFSLTFNLIWVVLSEYEQKLEINFNEDEIAFLTIYFQAAIERARMNRKILVVCQMGIATSELLVNRIKSVLPSLDTLEVASVRELSILNLNDYDLIISTTKVNILEKKVIVVSPFLTSGDIERIRESGYRPNKVNQLVYMSEGNHLKRFVDPKFVYVSTDYSSKEELLSNVGDQLVCSGYVNPEFVTSVLEREKLGGTDLPSGTAVPHGNTIHVNQTVIAMIKNKKKFKWNDYFVDFVFLICIGKQETSQTRKILSDIYNLIDNNESLKEIREASSKENLYKTLGSR